MARLSGRIEDRRRGRAGREVEGNEATATGLGGCRRNDDTGNEFDRRSDDCCVPGLCDSGGIVPTVAA